VLVVRVIHRQQVHLKEILVAQVRLNLARTELVVVVGLLPLAQQEQLLLAVLVVLVRLLLLQGHLSLMLAEAEAETKPMLTA
jgi:hypothetical protein